MKPFGNVAESINIDLQNDYLPIIVNGMYHDGLFDHCETALPMAERYEEWQHLWLNMKKTPQSSRNASRYQADAYTSLIGILRRGDNATNPEMIEKLSESEHRRWIAERTLAGWRGLHEGEQRDNLRKHHDCIKPYDQLSQAQKALDRNVIRFIIRLLSEKATQDD